MKSLRLVALVLVFVGLWWLFSRRSTAVPSPAALLKAEPVRIEKTLNVKAGEGMRWTVSPPDGKVPGLLQGQWSSRGKSAGIAGASDDSLVGFKLIGPDNAVIQELDHPTSGNFSVRITTPGNYTFVFDNQGIIRSSSRTVTVQATYQPD